MTKTKGFNMKWMLCLLALAIGACAALQGPLAQTQADLEAAGQPIVIRPATDTQPAIVAQPPKVLVSTTRKAGEVIKEYGSIIAAPDLETAVANGVDLALRKAPPKYTDPIVGSAVGILLAFKLWDRHGSKLFKNLFKKQS